MKVQLRSIQVLSYQRDSCPCVTVTGMVNVRSTSCESLPSVSMIYSHSALRIVTVLYSTVMMLDVQIG